GPHYESAAPVFPFTLDDPLQPQPLFFRCDLARHASVVHRRHEDQEASRQRNVTGDARALLCDRLLRDLDQHFLPFFEQFADLRHYRILAAAEAPSTAPSAPSIETAFRSATLRALQQPRLGCGTA